MKMKMIIFIVLTFLDSIVFHIIHSEIYRLNRIMVHYITKYKQVNVCKLII